MTHQKKSCNIKVMPWPALMYHRVVQVPIASVYNLEPVWAARRGKWGNMGGVRAEKSSNFGLQGKCENAALHRLSASEGKEQPFLSPRGESATENPALPTLALLLTYVTDLIFASLLLPAQSPPCIPSTVNPMQIGIYNLRHTFVCRFFLRTF